MPKSRTTTSTPRLSDLARHVVVPEGATTTAWPAVVGKCAELGIGFDPWQHGAGRVILSKRADGRYAAGVGGVVMSIPRQVGKTYLIGAIVFALCLLHPNTTVIWTAHRLRTAGETFRSMQAMAKRKKIAPFVENIVLGSGEEEVQFRNGSRVLFGARERGFGVGFAGVDVLVLDEAQKAKTAALDDMVPTTNQSKHPAGPLLFFIGTPPRPTDEGEVFTQKRTEALAGDDPDVAYVEFSADEGADPDDWAQVAKANPSYPSRTPREAILRMRKNLTADSYLREGLGIWDAHASRAEIDPITWDRVKDPASMPVERLSLGISTAPDRSATTVSLAGQRVDGKWHIEVVQQRVGTSWLVNYIVERCAKNKIRAVVIDATDPASALVDELKQAGVAVTVANTHNAAAAFALIYDGATDSEDYRHIDQPALNMALSLGRTKRLQVGKVWNPIHSPGDITAITSATFALWGAKNSTVKKPTRKRAGERRAVVI